MFLLQPVLHRRGVLTTSGGIAVVWIEPSTRERTSFSGVEARRGASAPSRKKTECPWIGLFVVVEQYVF